MTRSPGKDMRRAAVLSLLALTSFMGACGKRKQEPMADGKPIQPPLLPRKNYDTAKLFNGISLKSTVSGTASDLTALQAAADTNSYGLDINLTVAWPRAATNAPDLAAATPELPSLLPDLGSLLQGVAPSPDFAKLLEHKERNLRANLSTLQRLPYRDSLYDCQTILELRSRKTGRQALLVQAVMNVNTDGSDGDRNLEIEKLSALFQPQTNYRWAKSTSHPNPCLAEAEKRLTALEDDLARVAPATEAVDRGKQQAELSTVKATIAELKRWSFLTGTADPFIVLPSFMVGKKPGQPSIGDYAVVIAGGKLYPAVLGDLGPSHKIGEASLRLCRAIDPKSGADHRPASHPGVVYLVFPDSADKPLTVPDYKKWSDCCRALWKEFGGGDTAPWHEWTSLEKPWPTPTPSPLPSLSPSPEASSSGASGVLHPAGTNPATTCTPTTTVPPTNTTSSR